MLDRPDHMRNLEVVVVDRAGQMVQAASVGPLHDVVLLQSPLERDRPAHLVVEGARALARHLQAHDRAPALRRERRGLRGRRGHPAAAVDEPLLAALRRLALGLDFLGGRIVAVCESAGKQPVHRLPVARLPRRLEVRRVRAVHLRALVPVEPEPAEPVEDRLQCLPDVAPLVGVVDAQNELAAVPARVQPIEQGGPHAADVQVTGGARREPRADGHAVAS